MKLLDNKKGEFILALLLGYTPILVGLFLFFAGAFADFCIMILSVVLVWVNYKLGQKTSRITFLGINLILSVLFGVYLSTKLYYNNISSDFETMLVGKLLGGAAIGIAAICVLISVFVSIAKK